MKSVCSGCRTVLCYYIPMHSQRTTPITAFSCSVSLRI
ncbi:hypothetical protein DWW41_10575 [Butyricicoccus sp. AF15-40]|nr:hypothetical protein DWW41_10575 [Butyricicoccus sp. AF15-40]